MPSLPPARISEKPELREAGPTFPSPPPPAAMASKTALQKTTEFEGLDEALAAELPAFELFFKTFGFKRVHGRVWGLLVLAGQRLSSREIADELSLSQGATSTTLSEL